MLIIPKENPNIGNLNSYYLDIKKLIEHCQGEMGSGAIHFKGPAEEGAIFFDKDEILDGVVRDRDRELGGSAATDHLMDAARDNSYLIDIYAIDLERIYFWANLHGAVKIYKDLSTEFTDLEGLIRKMTSEKLTGYIEVLISKGEDGGLIFFNNGEIIGVFPADHLPLILSGISVKSKRLAVVGKLDIFRAGFRKPDRLSGAYVPETLLYSPEKFLRNQENLLGIGLLGVSCRFVRLIAENQRLDPFAGF